MNSEKVGTSRRKRAKTSYVKRFFLALPHCSYLHVDEKKLLINNISGVEKCSCTTVESDQLNPVNI